MKKEKQKNTSKYKIEVTIPEIHIPKRTLTIEVDSIDQIYTRARDQVKVLQQQVEEICNTSQVTFQYGYERTEANIFMNYQQWYLSLKNIPLERLSLNSVYEPKFGDIVHRGLFLLYNGGAYPSLSIECRNKLSAANLVSNGRITEKGKKAFQEINEKGPTVQGDRRVVYIAKQLLIYLPRLGDEYYQDQQTKLYTSRLKKLDSYRLNHVGYIAHWLSTLGFLKPDSSNNYKPLDTASQYVYDYRKLLHGKLKEHNYLMEHNYLISAFILCLQKDDLVPYLTNADEYIKKSAVWRYNELTEGKGHL